jgi:hypothetical protein
MAILTAIYAPGIPAAEVHSQLSPVNIFRLVLKNYFNVPIEPLPDRHEIYLDNNNLYSFKDVTHILRRPLAYDKNAELPADFRYGQN